MDLEVEEIAEALYDHWKSSSYELKRQGSFAEAPENLRAVFLKQGQAVWDAADNKRILKSLYG